MIAERSGRGSGRRRRWAVGLVAAGAAVAAAGVALPLLPGAEQTAQAPTPAPSSSSSATTGPSAPAAGGDFWAPSRSDRGEVRAQPWSQDQPTAVLGRG
ncbi:MAG: hypothetical protein PGN11_02700 [Quadrisphaera sp.]